METSKPSAKIAILQRMKQAGKPLAIHEFNLYGYSENSIGSRLPELAKAGIIVGEIRKGQAFKEWRFVSGEQKS